MAGKGLQMAEFSFKYKQKRPLLNWATTCMDWSYPFQQNTHVKTHKLLQTGKQIATSPFTSCRQVVFVLRVPMVVTDQAWLFQQVWYSHDRILRQPCVVNVLKILIQELCIGQPCNKSDILVKPVKSCQQVVPT